MLCAGRSVGYSTGGVGWYRKTFTTTNSGSERVSIRFDGVYMNVDMWVNGIFLGNHPYGYTTFAYDLTPHLAPVGSSNVIAVRVANNGATSRWYSGAGIFRHVHLTTTPALRIGMWGVAVSTPHVAPDASMAVVRVGVTLANEGTGSSKGGTVTVSIKSPTGDVVVTGSLSAPAIAAGATTDVVFENLVVNGTAGGANLSQPIELWTLNSPALYSTTVTLSGEADDEVDVTFGIRTISFTSEGGFLLNGVPTTMKGGCVHNDNGALGSATIDRAEYRRVENLKKLGYNAIRTSHNPVSPAFLDACDNLGMLVMDEAFDCWEKGKNTDDYHLYFDGWWQRDMTAMVKRDINHPSVVLWSIGNVRCAFCTMGSVVFRVRIIRVRLLYGVRVSTVMHTRGCPWFPRLLA
jgi:beta-galactosidase